MTLQELYNAFIGKQVEVAGSANAKNQCVDLANAKIRDVDGNPIIEWTNAVDFPSKAEPNYEFIPNSPTGAPVPGDLVIFKQYGSLYGAPGHIGICMYADLKTIKLFEQNYPTEGAVCRVADHNYLGCVGWMRPKPKINGYASVFIKYGYPANIPPETLEIIFSKYHEWRDKLQNGQLLTKEECDQKLKDANTSIDIAKISLQRNELYRTNLAKVLFGDESGDWDSIVKAVPKIIQEADSDKLPAKAAHDLFTKVNAVYHDVYLYPEDISKALESFHSLYLENKSKLDALEAQKVVDNKDEVINVTPEEAKSFIDNIVSFWRSIWQKSTAK